MYHSCILIKCVISSYYYVCIPTAGRIKVYVYLGRSGASGGLYDTLILAFTGTPLSRPLLIIIMNFI